MASMRAAKAAGAARDTQQCVLRVGDPLSKRSDMRRASGGGDGKGVTRKVAVMYGDCCASSRGPGASWVALEAVGTSLDVLATFTLFMRERDGVGNCDVTYRFAFSGPPPSPIRYLPPCPGLCSQQRDHPSLCHSSLLLW